MAQKSPHKTNALRAEFWTALPIDECRARIVAFEHDAAQLEHYSEYPLDPDYVFSMLSLTYNYLHYRQSFSQRINKTFPKHPYRLTLIGFLEKMTDGTRVRLRLTINTRLRLWFESLVIRRNTGPFMVILIIITGLLMLSSKAPEDQTRIMGIWFFLIMLVTWLSMLAPSITGRGARYDDLAAAAAALIASLHDDLYIPLYIPASDAAQL